MSGVRSSCAGVGDEPSQARFRRGALRERDLDLPEHRVEREPEPPDLAVLVGGLDALGEVAGGDRARGLPHLFERPELEAYDPPGQERQREQHRRRDQEEHEEQVMQRLIDVGEREHDHQHAGEVARTVRDVHRHHAIVRSAVRRMRTEVAERHGVHDARQHRRDRVGAVELRNLKRAVHDRAARVEELAERAVGEALQSEARAATDGTR